MTAQVFILNESHPENIEIQQFPDDDAPYTHGARAFCPRCGGFSVQYGEAADSPDDLARSVVRQLSTFPCNVHIGELVERPCVMHVLDHCSRSLPCAACPGFSRE